jgi:hypothetical protein
MDGISAATSVIALVEVTAKLISICWKYKGVKHAAQAAKSLISQLEGLKTLLVQVDELLEDQNLLEPSRRTTLASWATDERLDPFSDALERLIQQLQPHDGFKAVRETLLFPLRQKDLADTLTEIERMKSSLSLALTADQTARLGAIEMNVLDVRYQQDVARDEQRAQMIQQWLAAPDVTSNQAQKQSERHIDTGLWLLRLPSFEQWLVHPNTLLWIHGIPGSGKSVLSSTVHKHALANSTAGLDKIAIYFYFDVSEESKRSTDSMLKGLISQLSHHKMENKLLNDTYDLCQDKKHALTHSQLLAIFFDLLESYIDVVVSIDAIDEAVNVQESMQTILQIQSRKFDHVHIMLTSRWTRALEMSLIDAGALVMELSNDKVEHDISVYVHSKISRNQKWPEAIRNNISERIVYRAAGL